MMFRVQSSAFFVQDLRLKLQGSVLGFILVLASGRFLAKLNRVCAHVERAPDSWAVKEKLVCG